MGDRLVRGEERRKAGFALSSPSPMNPPKSVDWVRSVLGLLTAMALALNAYGDLLACIKDPPNHLKPSWSIALIVGAAVMVVFVAQELVVRLTEKHPFQQAARAEVRKLIKLHEKQATST